MCRPLAVANVAKAIHVGTVQSKGFEAEGGRRWVNFGSKREEGGSGEGERRGWEVV